MELFLLVRDNYIGNHNMGRKMHRQRKIFKQNLYKSGNEILRRELYNKLTDPGLGREFVIVAKLII